MKLPLKWLKEYVDFNVTPEKFVELMMWRGFEVADIEDEMPGITNVVVGRIEALSKHLNADKLQICSINVGREENVCIVTDRKSTRLNSSHYQQSRMPSSA